MALYFERRILLTLYSLEKQVNYGQITIALFMKKAYFIHTNNHTSLYEQPTLNMFSGSA